MGDISDYEVMMKMLEIIELKQRNKIETPSDAENEKIVTIIEKIEGNLLLYQGINQEVDMKIEGDKFENINNSIIATRGSIAKGIIKIRESNENDIADALEKLERLIAETDSKIMPSEEQEKALKLLEELTKQASSPSKVKIVLDAIGKSLWEIIKNIKPIVDGATVLWPVIQKLWN
jgi:hypothetical protein